MYRFPPQNIANKFISTFGEQFKNYWNIMTGFDIIAFDQAMQDRHGYVEGDGEEILSLNDFITEKFGQEASDLIKRLIIGIF